MLQITDLILADCGPVTVGFPSVAEIEQHDVVPLYDHSEDQGRKRFFH